MMLQFNFEIAIDLLTAVVFAFATYVCFVRVRRKRNNALLLLGSTSLTFGLNIFLQAISYVILLENQDLAFLFKQLSVVFSVLGYIIVFMFVNYVWFERIRLIGGNYRAGVLTFKKMDLFTVGLLSSRSSQMLNRSFEAFTLSFNTQFRAALEQFQGNLDTFNEANRLVKTYFDYVPISMGE